MLIQRGDWREVGSYFYFLVESFAKFVSYYTEGRNGEM
jgi:hypothetical protein